MDGFHVLLICGSLVVSQLLSFSSTLLPYFYNGEYHRNKKIEDTVKKLKNENEQLKDDVQAKIKQTENNLKSKMKNIEDKMKAIQEQHKVVLANCRTTSTGEYKTVLGYTDNSMEIAKMMTNKVGETVSKEFGKYLEDIGKRTDGVNKEAVKFKPKKRKFVTKNEHTRDWTSKKATDTITEEMKQEVDEYINTKNNETQDETLKIEGKAYGELMRCGTHS